MMPPLPPSDDTSSLLPSSPSGFSLIESVGKGGGGSVFLALEQSSNKLCALKYPRHDREGASERLSSEWAFARKLGAHRNIVHVTRLLALADGTPVLCMEYIKGETLHDRRSHVTAQELEHVLRQVAAALDHAHARRIVHRDVKPKNVLLGLSSEAQRHGHDCAGTVGRVCLTDWGIAIDLDLPRETNSGTEGFSLPGQEHSADGDVLQLAATTYGVLVGDAPFGVQGDGRYGAPSEAELRARLERSTVANLSKELVAGLLRALLANDHPRRQSASDFVQSLFGSPRELASARPVGPLETSPGVAETRRAPVVARSRVVTAAPFLALGGALSRVAIAFGIRGGQGVVDPPPTPMAPNPTGERPSSSPANSARATAAGVDAAEVASSSDEGPGRATAPSTSSSSTRVESNEPNASSARAESPVTSTRRVRGARPPHKQTPGGAASDPRKSKPHISPPPVPPSIDEDDEDPETLLEQSSSIEASERSGGSK